MYPSQHIQELSLRQSTEGLTGHFQGATILRHTPGWIEPSPHIKESGSSGYRVEEPAKKASAKRNTKEHAELYKMIKACWEDGIDAMKKPKRHEQRGPPRRSSVRHKQIMNSREAHSLVGGY